MKLKFVLIFSFLFINYSGAFSQGLNNEYAIDQEDLKHALDLIGLEIFKFPIKADLRMYLPILL